MKINKFLLILPMLITGSVTCHANIFERAYDELDYENHEWGVNIDYINRQFKLSQGGTSSNYNSWGDFGKKEHGFQVGMTYQPYFGYGQGLLTGMSFRMLMGTRDFGDDEYFWYEPSLYIPVMYRFTLPLQDDMAVFVQAGFGMSIGLGRMVSLGDINDSGYDYDYGYGYDYDLGYGNNNSNEVNVGYDEGNPKCVQFSVPVGFGFVYKHFEVSARYSFGLTDNASNYDITGDNIRFKERMWQIGISLLF